MADLHEALKHIGPINWQDVPVDNLDDFLTECFDASEIVINSVPPPASSDADDSIDAVKPHFDEPNTANSSKDIHPSIHRADFADPDHDELHKSWGKPMKFKKHENPLDVHIYKMAGKDRHGAWFSRRSIHEGIGFNKFKKAMMGEFATSLSVKGGPGAGAIRGLAADRRIEEKEENAGKLEVFELSAKFPGPVTPRDFETLLLTSDHCLSDKSAVNVEGRKIIPRHFMIVSRPVDHPEAPERSGLVRGHYESVELIREIPLTTAKSKSTPNLLEHVNTNSKPLEQEDTASLKEGKADGRKKSVSGETGGALGLDSDEAELNPVEWIMVTRSDPGGGIPRFLVDRGTPEAMLADINKLFDWACKVDVDADELPQQGEGGVATDDAPASTERQAGNENAAADAQAAQPGILGNITRAIGAGIDAYAPTAVSSLIHNHILPAEHETYDDTSDTSSVDSFMSAEELKHVTTAPEQASPDHADTLSLASVGTLDSTKSRANMSHHEKEVYKLSQKREKLEQQLAKKRLAEQTKLQQAQEKDEQESAKQKEKVEKEIQKMEEKHRKEIEKIEKKKAKEARKAEEKRRKRDTQSHLSSVTRERDEFRSQADLYKRENNLLHEQVADLQAQNNLLAEKLAKLGGDSAMKTVQDEFLRKRTSSIKSSMSKLSGDSGSRLKISVEAEGEKPAVTP